MIDQQLQRVKKCVVALRDRVEVLQVEQNAEMATTVERMAPELHYIRQKANDAADGIKNTKGALDELLQSNMAGWASQNGMFKTLTDVLLKADCP